MDAWLGDSFTQWFVIGLAAGFALMAVAKPRWWLGLLAGQGLAFVVWFALRTFLMATI